MFAASTFVDINDLEKQGFKSHRETRGVFFNKVRTLYDADLETDSLVLIQVLVLMTYWYDRPEDLKKRSHWMRIALSFATDIGLIHNSVLVGLSPAQQRLRRRLWWCSLMRDELISFSERQPSSITWDEIDFPPLSIDDLDSGALSKALERYHIPDHDKESEILTELCLQKIRLCVLIGRILHTQYELSSHRRRTSSRSKLLLIPKFSGSASAEYMSRDQELRKWGDDVCEALHDSIDKDPQRNSTLVGIHSAVLELLYMTVLGMAHRPQMLNRHLGDSAAKALQEFSQQTLRTAAKRISEIADYLSSAELLWFLPPIGLTALLFAAMQHIKDSLSSSTTLHNTAEQGLEWTVQAMIRLKEMYPQAHHALAFLELVRTKNLQVDESSERSIFSFFRDEATHYVPALQQAEADRIMSDAQERHELRVDYPNLNPSTESTSNNSVREGIDYSQRRGFSFESFLDLDEASEIFLSGNFDIAEFERVDWTEVFQDRSGDPA
ncbi:uncharacterized protein A1O9_06986 [Exophiala aquamarina CBS 119918]|uniref:Xylanolytic transcriptional activator regulatory domain-containing protein n=1 Tax=Exophiala aquamarina CBS 119918 TaxID=1182545 RepID=A0A072PAD9_9EURO|nr:uncharacterized protein A1O9_06986 [Exophiala aquamarina CBS 119918]KEF56796.1 hypothetical protein A1O9_06986 [Exophiala aquamarina CBS 119918]